MTATAPHAYMSEFRGIISVDWDCSSVPCRTGTPDKCPRFPPILPAARCFRRSERVSGCRPKACGRVRIKQRMCARAGVRACVCVCAHEDRAAGKAGMLPCHPVRCGASPYTERTYVALFSERCTEPASASGATILRFTPISCRPRKVSELLLPRPTAATYVVYCTYSPGRSLLARIRHGQTLALVPRRVGGSRPKRR